MPSPSTEPGLITVEQGVSLDVIFETFDDDAQATRTDWTGWRAALQARPYRGSMDAALLEVASDDGSGRLLIEPATDGPAGFWVRLTLSPDDTVAITQSGVYELVQADVNDETRVQPLASGPLVLLKRLVAL